jgi:hypothetical protein
MMGDDAETSSNVSNPRFMHGCVSACGSEEELALSSRDWVTWIACCGWMRPERVPVFYSYVGECHFMIFTVDPLHNHNVLKKIITVCTLYSGITYKTILLPFRWIISRVFPLYMPRLPKAGTLWATARCRAKAPQPLLDAAVQAVPWLV